MSQLADLPGVLEWLKQFDVPDRYLAEHILRKMRYVGFEEVERWLQESVKQVLADIQNASGGKKEAVAIFPVGKPFIHAFNSDKEAKPTNDSAGRLAHSLKNLERSLPSYVELTPRVESMRSQRVRHVIYVDDFIGTGDRFKKSWQTMVSPSIKAWYSRGWCKIWLLAFAGHTPGLKRLVKEIGPISRERIRVNLEIGKSFIAENDNLVEVLKKYGHRVGHGHYALGYGELLSPVVFQYGCPNNVTQLLWASGLGPKQARWMPLFPNRSVPADLYPLFSEDISLESTPEELWMARRYRLAIQTLERLSEYQDKHRLLLVLALLDSGKSVKAIKNNLVLSEQEFGNLMASIVEAGLVDERWTMTRFGKEFLTRAGKDRRRSDTEKVVNAVPFYPSSFMGLQREA